MLPQQVLSQDNLDELIEEASSQRRWSKAVFRDQSVCNAAACRSGLVSCSWLKRGRRPPLDRHAHGQEIADRSLRMLPDLHLTADDRLHEGPDLRVGLVPQLLRSRHAAFAKAQLTHGTCTSTRESVLSHQIHAPSDATRMTRHVHVCRCPNYCCTTSEDHPRIQHHTLQNAICLQSELSCDARNADATAACIHRNCKAADAGMRHAMHSICSSVPIQCHFRRD